MLEFLNVPYIAKQEYENPGFGSQDIVFLREGLLYNIHPYQLFD